MLQTGRNAQKGSKCLRFRLPDFRPVSQIEATIDLLRSSIARRSRALRLGPVYLDRFTWAGFRRMGFVMKKMVLVATMLAMTAGSALAADMAVKAYRAPPPVAFDPWDIAFGAGIMNDYVFRGVTQSNHKPSVTAYFEPRYNVTKDLQLYVGSAVESISFANRAAAEVDIYGGIRPTFGAFAFDFGVWGYLYPGGAVRRYCGRRSRRALSGRSHGRNRSVQRQRDEEGRELLRRLRQGELDHQRQLGGRLNEWYSPNFLNTGAWGNYSSVTAKYTAPGDHVRQQRRWHVCSGEFGRQWLGTSDTFYGVVRQRVPGARTASTTPITTPGISA